MDFDAASRDTGAFCKHESENTIFLQELDTEG